MNCATKSRRTQILTWLIWAIACIAFILLPEQVLHRPHVTLEATAPSCKLVNRIFPSDSNFLLIRVDDADLRYKQLIEAGIVVRNRSKEPLCEQCLRVTVGTREENEKLIDTLKSFE